MPWGRGFVCLSLSLLLAAPALAARKPKPRRTPAPAAPAAVVAPEPAPAATDPASVVVDPGEPTEALLGRARAAYEAMEYERVVPLATAVLERQDITPDQKLDGCLLQASSLAIIGDQAAAEQPFRMLLRGRPDYDMPDATPPKILAVFRRVQTEEKAIAEQLRAIEKARIVKGLRRIGQHPQVARGGFALPFAYRLQDPTAAVDTLRVLYRRQGESSYATLALARDPEGVWRGALPGEWTASEQGFAMEFYLSSAGPLGELLQDGTAAAPHRLAVAPGSVDDAVPPPLPPWAPIAVGAGALALGLGSAATGVAFNVVQSDYRTMATSSEVIDGRELNQLGDQGELLALTTNVLLVAAGVAVVAAGAMVPFTNWSGESAELPPAVVVE